MKTFVYTRTERTPRNGHTTYTVRLWRMVRNQPVFVGESQAQFVGDFQQVWELMEAKKCLPRKAFDRHASGGYSVGNAFWARERKVAFVHRLA